MAAVLCALLLLLCLLGYSGVAEAHGYLALPSSKNAGTEQSFRLPPGEHFITSSWWLDKASFDSGNPSQSTPWIRPGHFNFRDARDHIQGFPQTFHPCGCYNPAGPAFCAGVEQATRFGETTTGAFGTGVGPSVTPPRWERGSSQNTSFNLHANHAGGYLYMLCKKSTFDRCRAEHLPAQAQAATQLEKDAYLLCVWSCFEENVLDFVDGSQRLQYEDNQDLFVRLNAVTKAAGTLPAGSVWRELPIPDSNQVTLGGEGSCTRGYVKDFSNDEVKERFAADFGDEGVCDAGPKQHNPSSWHIKDQVQVPSSLANGEYLLSWRWDCFKADQIWTNCADVEVVGASATTTPTPAATTTTLGPATSTSTSTSAPGPTTSTDNAVLATQTTLSSGEPEVSGAGLPSRPLRAALAALAAALLAPACRV